MSSGFEQVADDDVDGNNFGNHLRSLQALLLLERFYLLGVPSALITSNLGYIFGS